MGSYALGASYISLPWWCGQAIFGTLDRPVYWVLPILYSIAGLGIAIVNDFKSIEGDRAMGLNSLPVAFGVDGAKYICAGSVTLTQSQMTSSIKHQLNHFWCLVFWQPVCVLVIMNFLTSKHDKMCGKLKAYRCLLPKTLHK